MLQLLGEFVPHTPYRGFAPGPHWVIRPPDPIVQWRSQKFSTGGALISGFPSCPPQSFADLPNALRYKIFQ